MNVRARVAAWPRGEPDARLEGTVTIVAAGRTFIKAGEKVNVLEKIARCPKAKRLHVFAATPMCVSLALGRQVRPPVHPEVYVYNFRRNEDPPYGWRLLLTEDAEAGGLTA